MSAGLYPAFQFFDNNGEPLNGGLVYTYEPGTTTPKASYQDAALTTPQANPIVLSAFGRPPAPIWLNGETKVVVKTAAEVTLDTVDNVNAGIAGLAGWATKQDGVMLKSANYDLTAADDGKTLVATAGSWTLGTAEVASLMGEGFVIDVLNAGPGVITFDPNGSETVNGESSLNFGPGDGGRLVCDGSNWRLMQTRNVEKYGVRNRLINSEFIIGQRMTSFSQTVTSGNVYGFDRWTAHGSAGIAGVFAQRSGPLAPGGPLYAARLIRSSGTYVGAAYLSQAIEMANCFDLAGRTVTLSFKARRGSGYSEPSSNIQARIRSGTVADEGVGGLTAGTWTGILTDASQNFTLTTSWQTFSLSATLQAGAQEVGVMLGIGSFSGTGSANDWVEFTDVQLELGSVATPYNRRPFSEQLDECQRYFEKSYDLPVQPGAVSSSGYQGMPTNGAGAAYMPVSFRQRKRGSPAVTLYNHATVSAGTWRDGGGIDRAVGTTGIGQAGFTVACTGASVNSSVGGHWVADAEL